MVTQRPCSERLRRGVLLLAPLALLSCNGDAHEALRATPPAAITLEMTAPGGELRRPAVLFEHSKHTTALKEEGCKTCHLSEKDQLVFSFKGTEDPEDAESLISLYHDACGSCHAERALKSPTPVACAECHVEDRPAESERVPMTFDYSLHGRHSKAANDKCETCHHVLDEDKKTLVYQKGKESACRDCHGAVDDGKNLSLANASHQDCVNCHVKRRAQGETAGPELCVGCHDREKRAAIAVMDEIPRIERGQPSVAWMKIDGGKSKLVGFNHAMHEPLTRSCSTCHHQSLNACSECHTLSGDPKGGGITTADAHHDTRSEHSCVGCHQHEAAEKDCGGCHNDIEGVPSEDSCAICHNGPLPDAEEIARLLLEGPNSPPEEAQAAKWATRVSAPPPALPPLPAVSADFPEKVVIDRLAKEYGPSTLPHQKIVARLHAAIDGSSLARRFHSTPELLCSGCHHRTPEGARPPSCASCHGDEGAPTTDKPGLKEAYHRQCMQCHEQVGVAAKGCTDCHARAGKEVTP